MSTTKTRGLLVAALLVSASGMGCWEQNLPDWFPQMKRQPAVQAFESMGHGDQIGGFVPPEGTVPIGYASLPDLASMTLAEQDALENPAQPSFESLKNGEEQYQRYCSACHGAEGLGDGPVAASSPFAQHATGPFAMVLPLAGQMSMSKVFTDGHIYTTISMGRGRMPSYQRVPHADRWDIVNYVREMNTER